MAGMLCKPRPLIPLPRAPVPQPGGLMMLPSFVDVLPSGEERGECYAIDLGGTNLRVRGHPQSSAVCVPFCVAGMPGRMQALTCVLFSGLPDSWPQVAHVVLGEGKGEVAATHIRWAKLGPIAEIGPSRCWGCLPCTVRST